ncbi:MAG: DUF3808 domain-containing protein [Acidobacteria bacterium]|nr:DUF3808 domain-containing protein [Acidobacteriota bacterium]
MTAKLITFFEYMAITATVLALTLLLPVNASGQSEPRPAAEASITPAALSPEIIELRRAGTEAVYNLDYATARAKFEEIRRQLPSHPVGDLNLATLLWLEYLNKNRRLQTGLYKKDSSFYAGAEKAQEESEGDTVDPAFDRAFRDRMAQAKTKALALANRNRNDPDAIYFLGAYYGVMAGYEASTARKFFAAMRNGSRSVDAHEKVVKLRPDYNDAYLSIGLYDYIVGSLPFAYKALAAVAGVRGNKQRGIERLVKLIESNSASSDDARVLLMAVYQNEGRFEDALAILKSLNSKYPASYLLKLETASTLVELKRADEAYRTFESLLNDPTSKPVFDLIQFQYAEALALNNQFKTAADHFLAVPKIESADANLATMALLRAAQVTDLAGNRDLAISQYKSVLARTNVYDSREQAERGIKKPFNEKDRIRK